MSALAAAVLFGASTPIAKLLSNEVSPVLLAGLLYLGSGIGLWLIRIVRDRGFGASTLPAREWPWLVGAIARGLAGQPAAPPAPQARLEAACEHVDSLLATMGGQKGLRHARKHLSAYAHHAGADEAQRLRLVTSDRPEEVFGLLRLIFSHIAAPHLPVAA